MKFDEWGMRKYKSQKTRSNTGSSNQTHFTPPPASGNIEPSNTSPHSTDAEMGPRRSESTAMEIVDSQPETITELLASINLTTANALEILETILQHWQPDPSFTDTLKQYFHRPDFNKWVSGHNDQPVIFNLIEKHVDGRENQFNLIKILLEADLSCRREADDPTTPWQESWYKAICYSQDWERGKEVLSDEDHILWEGSRVFLDCAEVVIAEKFLEKYTQFLTMWSNRPLDSVQVAEKEKYTRKYRDILRSFHHAKDDVCPRFYRFLLRFDLADRSEETRSGRGYEDEYRQKYIILACLRPQRLCGMVHDKDEEHIDMSWFFGDTNRPSSQPLLGNINHLQVNIEPTTNNLPPTPPTPTNSKPRPFTITTTKALEILIQKWHSLSGFEEYTHALFSRDGSPLSIFTASESENIFDAINTAVTSPADRISLAKALLVTSTTFSPPTTDEYVQPWLLDWWQTLYPCSPSTSPSITYDRFRTNFLETGVLNQELAKVVRTEEGRKLVMDAAISLVGERLLWMLKNFMGKVRWGDMGHMRVLKKYLSVIGVMEERRIAVDPSWIGYTIG